MPADSKRVFTAFHDATWGRTDAGAHAITSDLSAADDGAQNASTRARPGWSRLRDYDERAGVRQVVTGQAISSTVSTPDGLENSHV